MIAAILIGLTSFDWNGTVPSAATTVAADKHERLGNQHVGKKMKVTIGSKTFAATLDDYLAAAELKAMLPLTQDMSELNGNEKYCHLAAQLPTDAANPGTIRTISGLGLGGHYAGYLPPIGSVPTLDAAEKLLNRVPFF